MFSSCTPARVEQSVESCRNNAVNNRFFSIYASVSILDRNEREILKFMRVSNESYCLSWDNPFYVFTALCIVLFSIILLNIRKIFFDVDGRVAARWESSLTGTAGNAFLHPWTRGWGVLKFGQFSWTSYVYYLLFIHSCH